MNSNDKDSIRAILTEYDQVCAVGDAAAYSAFFTDDAVFMPPNAPTIEGRPAIEDWANDTFEGVNIQLVSKEAEIEITGDWAIVRGTYSITYTPEAGGESREEVGKWLVIMSRQPDGSWKYARTMWNSDK